MQMTPKQSPFASSPSPSNAGFTLTELLVVIIIIVTLAALSMVGIQTMRQTANTARCTDNLRTWGISLQGYASEHNGQVVWNGWASISSSARHYETYLGGDQYSAVATMNGKNVFATQLHRRCPSQKWNGTGNGPVGYGMTRPNPQTPNSSSFNLGTASDPSQLLLMIDAEDFLNLRGPDDIVSAITPLCDSTDPRHRKTVNALFGDGHVSNYKWGDIADSGKKAMRERWFTLR